MIVYVSGSFWRGLLLGALIGAVLGLLLAPRHGEETRAAVRAHLANARREAEAARATAEREVLQRYEAIVAPPPSEQGEA